MTCMVTGGAGFIANSLIALLLKNGLKVVAVDNLALGRLSNLDKFYKDPNFSFENVDLSNRDSVGSLFAKVLTNGPIEEIWHLAANSDIPKGVTNSDVDFRDTFQTTYEVLFASKQHNIKKFYFASSSAVYGDQGDKPISESFGPLLPISNYGAMKLASEGLVSASSESFLEKAVIFRFPNVVGTPATHGIIFDFINKLLFTQDKLIVLGNGSQCKSYLHVSDLVNAMHHIVQKDNTKLSVYNIGPMNDKVTVKWIAEEVIRQFSPKSKIEYGVNSRGWVGDIPVFSYDTSKLKLLGWTPTYSSQEAVSLAVTEIINEISRKI